MDIPGAVDHLVTQGFTRAAVYSVTGADFAAQGGDWQVSWRTLISLLGYLNIEI